MSLSPWIIADDYPTYDNVDFGNMPLDDPRAYEYFGTNNWVYNKLTIAEEQALRCGPIGTLPTTYPIIVKPVFSMYYGAPDTHVVYSREEYEALLDVVGSGSMWCEFLEGEHYSTDIVVNRNNVLFNYTMRGLKSSVGAFDGWDWCETPNFINQEVIPQVVSWLEPHCGIVNFETIGNHIIEVHLRMGDVYLLQNEELMNRIINVFYGEVMGFDDLNIRKLFIRCIFGSHDPCFWSGSVETIKQQYPSILEILDETRDTSTIRPPGKRRLFSIAATKQQEAEQAKQQIIRELEWT